jgi:hypothetical protein
MLLLVFIYAAYPINESLYRAEHPTQKYSLSGKHLGHINSKRLGYAE